MQGRERERLLALELAGVLDTAPERDFDGLARVAARVSGCAQAWIGFLDEERYWLKARVGPGAGEVPRALALCDRVVGENLDELVVEDASADPRFSTFPVVQLEGLRCYAAFTLRAGALRLPVGTLCVAHPAPLALSPEQLDTLRVLKRSAEQLLERGRRDQDVADLARRLHTAEERVRAVVDATHDGVVLQLADGTISWHNRTAERVLGLTGDQLVGRTSLDPRWRALKEDGTPFPGEQHPAMVCLRGGEPVREVVMGVGVGDEVRWIRINAEPLRHVGETRPYAVVTSFTDFTRLKAQQEALVRARDAAQAEARSKAAFLATMSHELRTPLTGVIGMAELLQAGAPPEEQREMVQTIHDSGRTLLAVINDVLDFSKLEAGGRPLAREPLDLGQLAAEVLRPLQPLAARKGVALRAEVPKEAGALGDEEAVRQVLTNLVGNALKFTPQGKVVLAVSARDGGWQVEVRDTGIGISAAQQAGLFEPWAQAEPSTARRYGGSGLGLAISRRLVRELGSDLALSSAVGAGSAFWFELPGAPCPPRRVSRPTPLPLPAGAALPVLLVEDNPVSQRVGLAMLARLGHQAVLAREGFEAVDFAARGDFDLALMDVGLPGMDGLEATRQIRQLPGWADRPIYALTAGVLAEERQACAAAGMTGALGKPITLETLARALSAIAPRG